MTLNPAQMTPRDFRQATGIDNQTLERFQAYAELLVKWQARINLVGSATLPDLWRRHFLDSAQLYPLLPPGTRVLVDLGSGAGFPGLVLALLGVPNVHLMESDHRKASFLREAARLTKAPVTLHTTRIEALTPFPADVITSRALAPLPRLLGLGAPFLKKTGIFLLLKGKNVDLELTDSQKIWNMAVQRVQSVTNPSGAIVRLERVYRHHGIDDR